MMHHNFSEDYYTQLNKELKNKDYAPTPEHKHGDRCVMDNVVYILHKPIGSVGVWRKQENDNE